MNLRSRLFLLSDFNAISCVCLVAFAMETKLLNQAKRDQLNLQQQCDNANEAQSLDEP